MKIIKAELTENEQKVIKKCWKLVNTQKTTTFEKLTKAFKAKYSKNQLKGVTGSLSKKGLMLVTTEGGMDTPVSKMTHVITLLGRKPRVVNHKVLTKKMKKKVEKHCEQVYKKLKKTANTTNHPTA